jgi:hypothetical protein
MDKQREYVAWTQTQMKTWDALAAAAKKKPRKQAAWDTIRKALAKVTADLRK